MLVTGCCEYASADDLQAVSVRHAPFSILGTSDQGYAAVFHGHAISITDAYVTIRTVIEGGGKTYVVIGQNCGGSSCGEYFRFIDVSTDTPVSSAVFGSGCWEPGPFEVINGVAHVRIPDCDRATSEDFTYRDGRLSRTKVARSMVLTGPAVPAGGDYVTFLRGKTLVDVLSLRATAPLLRRLMDADSYSEAQKLVLSNSGEAFKIDDNLAIADAFNPGDVDNGVTVMFNRNGDAVVDIKVAGRTRVFGNREEVVTQR